jgi:hypothetical protein
MKNTLVASAALAFALGMSGSSFADPGTGPQNPPNPVPGKPTCTGESTTGTPGSWIANNVALIQSDGTTTPGQVVKPLATDGGAGVDVQSGLESCDLGSQPN